MQANSTLRRKQYLLSDENLSKISAIQRRQGKSAAEVVREAIAAYNPGTQADDPLTPEAVAFLAEQIREAITTTQAANEKVESLLAKLDETN